MAFGRQVSREILVYSLGSFLASGLIYLAVPIYTRIFPPEEYSQLAFVQTASAALAGILLLGGDTAYSRFWFEADGPVARRSLTVTWIGFLTAWSMAVTLLLLPFSGALARWGLGSPDLGSLFVLGLVALPFVQAGRMLAQILRNEFRAVAFASTSVALGGLTLCIGLLLVVYGHLGVGGILAGVIVAEVVMLLVRLWLVRDQFAGSWDTSLLPSLLRFALPLVPVSVSYWVISGAERVVVGALAGAEELGYYAVSASVVAVFAVLLVAVGQAWLPRITQLYETSPVDAAAVGGRALGLLVAVLGLMAAAISTLAPVIVSVVAGPAYAPAADVLPMLTLGAVAFGTTVITSSGLTLVKRTRPLAGAAITAAAANVVVALSLVPVMGMFGAATASVLGYTVLTSLFLVMSQRVWRMDVSWGRIAAMLVSLLAVVAICTAWGSQMSPLRLGLLVLYVAVVVVALPAEYRRMANLGRYVRRG